MWPLFLLVAVDPLRLTMGFPVLPPHVTMMTMRARADAARPLDHLHGTPLLTQLLLHKRSLTLAVRAGVAQDVEFASRSLLLATAQLVEHVHRLLPPL